jgi:hypothetical protein
LPRVVSILTFFCGRQSSAADGPLAPIQPVERAGVQADGKKIASLPAEKIAPLPAAAFISFELH